MVLSVIIDQMIQLFLVILLGFFLRRIGLLSPQADSLLTRLLLNVTLPAMVLDSVLTQAGERDNSAVLAMFLIALGFFIFLTVLAFFLVKLLRLPREQQGHYMMMTVFSNSGFMGFPIVGALFGPVSVFYAAIFNIVFNVWSFTVGIFQLNYDAAGKARVTLRTLLTPGIIASVLAVFIYLADLSFPAPVASAMASVGNITTPVAMLLVGSSLGSISPRELFCDWHMYPFTLVRQLVLPAALLPLLRLFIHNELMCATVFTLTLMPVANICLLLCNQYGGNTRLVARTVIFSTLLSLVTIPLLLALLL